MVTEPSHASRIIRFNIPGRSQNLAASSKINLEIVAHANAGDPRCGLQETSPMRDCEPLREICFHPRSCRRTSSHRYDHILISMPNPLSDDTVSPRFEACTLQNTPSRGFFFRRLTPHLDPTSFRFIRLGPRHVGFDFRCHDSPRVLSSLLGSDRE